MEENKIVWGTLKLRVDTLDVNERKKIDEALNLLDEVGIRFDSGTDGSYIDLELDWSLKGATLLCFRERECMSCGSKDNIKRYPVEIEGTIFENYCFCSDAHYQEYIIKVAQYQNEKLQEES